MSGPNLFFLCPPRSGSTQLAHWLNSHPQISASAIKEPNYFARLELAQAPEKLSDVNPAKADVSQPLRYQYAVTKDFETYRSLFAPLRSDYRLDASTSTLTSEYAAEEIAHYFPQSRFIAILRDPLDRAISHYKLTRRMGKARHSLGQALWQERAGNRPKHQNYLLRYANLKPALARFEKTFGTDAILYLEFKDLIQKPKETLQKCSAFLALHYDFDLGINAQNKGALPRFSTLNYWCQHSGLTGQLRRTLPPWSKPALRRIWHKSSWDEKICQNDIEALRQALEIR